MPATVSDARIQIHFNVHDPVELVDLTLSLGALAREYRKYLTDKARQIGAKPHDDDVKLYITRIEKNCIFAELAGATVILGQLFQVMDYTVVFLDFTERVRSAIQFFRELPRSEGQLPAIPYSKRECENFADLVNVVAKNKNGELGLSVVELNQQSGDYKSHLKMTFTGSEAYEAQKGALLAQRLMDEKGQADYKNVLMYFHQADIEDPKVFGRTGDRAVIRSIWPKPLPVYIVSGLDSDRIKSLVDDPKRNPFKASYRVDVNVETDRNKVPRYYRVVRLHEILGDTDEELDEDNID